MSKIFEALQLEQRKRNVPVPAAPHPIVPDVYRHNPNPDTTRELISLYYMLDCGGPGRKLIQFIGSQENEGTSTLVREFGMIAAQELGKFVLLFDADFNGNQGSLATETYSHVDLELLMKNGVPLDHYFSLSGDNRFFISPVSNRQVSPSSILNSPDVDPVLDRLREHFDLILIDSPPLSVSPHGLAMCRKVDAVILVVEAENTKWPVVEQARDRIQQAGGNILGVVLNKQRLHVPPILNLGGA